MKLFISALLLTLSASAFALPMMNTKEAVRLELWYYGVTSGKSPSELAPPKSEPIKPLPIELEQALLKF